MLIGNLHPRSVRLIEELHANGSIPEPNMPLKSMYVVEWLVWAIYHLASFRRTSA